MLKSFSEQLKYGYGGNPLNKIFYWYDAIPINIPFWFVCFFTLFITDLLEHYNKLNTKLQGRNQFIDKTWGCIKAFKCQLLLFCRCLESNDLSHFPRLSFFRAFRAFNHH